MDLSDFLTKLNSLSSNEEFYDFCRKIVLHGIPYVFHNRENDFYEFRKKIALNFHISFHEVYIIGSAKLGFSPFKKKNFDYDSDIDVAIISPQLFKKLMRDISKYQMNFRNSRATVTEYELKMYHQFLEYVALGWIRPDKLPLSFQMKSIKDDWFAFFDSLSNGKSEVGNYKVAAGVFQSYEHLEDYIIDGFKNIKQKGK